MKAPKIELSTNRYRNRHIVRDAVNAIAKNGFKKFKEMGWSMRYHADIHIADRLTDREFPLDEFFAICHKIAHKDEFQLVKIFEDQKTETYKVPVRINCYGHGAWMVGITLTVYRDHKAIHVSVRTCYKERNMVHRVRDVDVKQVWTRGKPHWITNPQPFDESRITRYEESVKNESV